MDNQNVTVNLSGISFALDAKTQVQIVKEVTESVLSQVQTSLSQLAADIKQTLASISGQPIAANSIATSPSSATETAAETPRRRGGRRKKTEIEAATVAEPVEATPRRRGGRRKKTEVEATATQFEAAAETPSRRGGRRKKEEAKATVEEQPAKVKKIRGPRGSKSLKTLHDLKELKNIATAEESSVAAPAAQPKVAETGDEFTDKLNREITQFAGYDRFPDFINEMGFKTLYDLFVFKVTKTGPAHFQEQTIIDEFLNVSRLKVFAVKAQKYVAEKETSKNTRKKNTKTDAKEGTTTKPATAKTGPLIESFDISQTLKGFCRNQGIDTVDDALLFCNEVKLKTLIAEGTVNRHAMIYQLGKFLCTYGFGTKPIERFLVKVENGLTGPAAAAVSEVSKIPVKPSVVSRPDADIPVYNQNVTEPETAEEQELRSNRFHKLTEQEINALYSNVEEYPFAEYLQNEVFKKLKITSIFELLFWFCGITRDHVAYQFDLDKNALRRLETILEENGFIDPINKLESMSYAYRSKYYHYIRYFRNKIINNKLYLNKFNKNLTEEDQDHLYMSIDDMGFEKPTLNVLKYNKINNAISLIAFIYYGCDTAYPKQFTQPVLDEIEKVTEDNGLNKYKYQNYVKGLRSYYYKSSMFIQKRKIEQGEFNTPEEKA